MRGSIVKRGKTYSYVFALDPDSEGKRRQKWVGGFRTKREAETGLAEALGRLQAGTYSDAGRQTVRDFCEQWIESVASSLAPSTVSDYRRIIQQMIIPRLGKIRLGALTPAHISKFDNDLLKGGGRNGKPLAPRSVVYAHAVLGRALQDALRWGLIARNPSRMVKRPKAPKSEMSVWTAEQARQFLEHVSDDRHYALWFLLLTTGLRRGEVAALRWSDIDLAVKTLSVQRTRVTVDYTVVENEPKTPQSRRRLALDADTVEALRAHRSRQNADRKQLGDDWQQTGYVFTDEIGAAMHPQAITDRFQKLAAAAGVPVMRLHDLRHTSATLALSAGVHPKVVQERLGHSSIMITMDTYSHVVQGMQEEAAEKLAGLLR